MCPSAIAEYEAAIRSSLGNQNNQGKGRKDGKKKDTTKDKNAEKNKDIRKISVTIQNNLHI